MTERLIDDREIDSYDMEIGDLTDKLTALTAERDALIETLRQTGIDWQWPKGQR